MNKMGLAGVLVTMILAALALGGMDARAKEAKEAKAGKPDMGLKVASFVFDGKKNNVTLQDIVYERMLNPRFMMAPTSDTQRRELARELTNLAAYRSLLYLDGLKKGIDRSTTVSLPLEQQLNTFLQRRLKAVVTAEAPAPTPQAIEQYYQAHKSDYAQKEMFQFQYIFSYCENPADAAKLAQARKRIDEAKAQLDQHKDFAEVAKRYSNSPSGNTGEVTGLEPGTGKINPIIEDAVRKLADGAVSGVLQLGNGFTIVRRVKHQKAGQKSLADVRDEIRATLAAQAGEAQWNKFYQERLNELKPSVNRQLLQNAEIKDDAPIFHFADQTVTYGQVRPRVESAAASDASALKVDERNKRLDAIFQEMLSAHIARQRGLDKEDDFSKMRRQTLRELIYNVELNRQFTELQAKVEATPAEIERYYNENKKYFVSERETKLNVIRVQAPGATKGTRLDLQQKSELFQRAEALRRKLSAGEDFAALMKQTNGDWDGNWDFQPYGPRGHEVDLAVEKLKAGEISTPVDFGTGFYIIKLVEAKEPKPLPLAEVRDKVIKILRGSAAYKQVEALRAKRLDESRFHVDQQALAQVAAAL